MEEPVLNFSLKKYTDDTPDISDIGQDVKNYVIEERKLDEAELQVNEELAIKKDEKDLEDHFQLTGNCLPNQLLHCDTYSYLQSENHMFNSVPLNPSWNVHFSSGTQTDQSMLFGYNWYNGWMNHSYEVGSQYSYTPLNEGHQNNNISTTCPPTRVPENNEMYVTKEQSLEEAATTCQKNILVANKNVNFENSSKLDVSCNGVNGTKSKLSPVFPSEPLILSDEHSDLQQANIHSSDHSEELIKCDIKTCASKPCDISNNLQSGKTPVILSNTINFSLKDCYIPLIRVKSITGSSISAQSLVSEKEGKKKFSKGEVDGLNKAGNVLNSVENEKSIKASDNIAVYCSPQRHKDLPHSISWKYPSLVSNNANEYEYDYDMLKGHPFECRDKMLSTAEEEYCADQKLAASYCNVPLKSYSVSKFIKRNLSKPCEGINSDTVVCQKEENVSKCVEYCETTNINKKTKNETTIDSLNYNSVKPPASIQEKVFSAAELVDKCQQMSADEKSKENAVQQSLNTTDLEKNTKHCLKTSAKIQKFSPGDKQGYRSSSRKSCSKIQDSERTRNHISYLLNKLPDLAKYFHVHRKVGEGTFSSVFLGTVKQSFASQFPELRSRKFAIKHLIPTILPKRIARELKFLHQIGGKDNVIGVDLTIREGDCCVFVMPYLSHKRFSEYVLDMDADETRDYIRNLMIALKRVHSFNVIHRDVKPSNFLYNRDNKRYLLVDFGLSQNMHPQAKWTANERAKKRKRQEENISESMKRAPEPPCKLNGNQLKTKRMALQPRSKEDVNVQKHCAISQPIKRQRLTDSGSRSQKMIAHLQQEHSSILENRRAPLTPKVANKQNIVSSQTFKLPYSSPKVLQKELSIRKKLFASNNENELPKACSTPSKFETPSSNLSSPLSSRKSNAQVYSPISHAVNVDMNNQSQPAPVTSNNISQQKFQILVPKSAGDGSGGQTIVRVQNSQVKSKVVKQLSPLESEMQRKLLLKKQGVKKPSTEAKCFCKGLPQVCNICLKNPAVPAPRAGTPGFRPPEVLLKYPMQTTAVDMWAAGVIMLCILSGCYPFFRAPDDITALAEIMTVFGTDSIQSVAKSLGRTVVCGDKKPPLDLRKLCERLRRRRKGFVAGVPDNTDSLPICFKCENTFDAEFDGCLCLKEHCTPHESGEFPSSAYDLLKKLLDLNPVTRISAEEALQHPFLNGE